jgi:drug/metabolite transporter (DMT)-like permease
MKSKTLQSDALLLLTAIIWGFAFVAQRMGMDHVGPFTFNAIRFALGSLVLVPFIMRSRRPEPATDPVAEAAEWRTIGASGLVAGVVLFGGASLQQAGLVFTTAGNAGFITGLYVVIVPLLGLLFKQRTNTGSWIGAILASLGLYFLSISEQFTIAFGDLLVLLGAFFWAGHVLLIGWMSPRMDPLKLACTQFATCSVLSMATAVGFETIAVEGILAAALPILYGGALSVGVAYTLQVVAQRNAHPAHAAILLSLEAVFAAIGGWIVLDETLGGRGFFGCSLMLTGMLLSQLWGLVRLRPIKAGAKNA